MADDTLLQGRAPVWRRAGQQKAVNAAGATVQSTGYGLAPLFALTGTINF